MAKYERELAAFTGSGLDDVVVDDTLTCLLTFVRAAARIGVAAGAAHGSAHDPEHAAAFGLARVLDALERLAGVTSPG